MYKTLFLLYSSGYGAACQVSISYPPKLTHLILLAAAACFDGFTGS